MSEYASERSPQKPFWAEREAEARHNAEALETRDRPLAAKLHATPIPAQSAKGKADDLGEGEPLAPAERARFESRFGRDFSHVRVHADAEAAALADEASARAFTTGRHVVFGAGERKPDTAEGDGLLAHELTHVAQQGADSGATQCEPKPGKRGIGAAPPSEPVQYVEGIAPASEDGFVLFDQDSATLSAASVKKLRQIVGSHPEPVTVEVDGYASREGDEDYNRNLSGHRAVAVKKELLELLPQGSRVILYGRGETREFGERSQNRRAGIKVTVGVTSVPADAPAGDDKDVGPGEKPITTLRMRKGPKLFPETNPDLGPGPGPEPPEPTPSPVPTFTLPPLRTSGLLDWSEMRSPFTARALRLTDRDQKAIEQNWWTTYRFLRSVGLSPDLAAWGANKGTSYAYDKLLSHESPNTADLFDQEWDKTRLQLQPGLKEFRTPIVPILTPTTLEWISKKVFKKDWKFTF